MATPANRDDILHALDQVIDPLSGRSALGPRKFLNRSSSGEPGGTLGMAEDGGAFKVWVVAILTTVGSSLAAKSAKESGAGRAIAGPPARARAAQNASANRMSVVLKILGTGLESLPSITPPHRPRQTGF